MKRKKADEEKGTQLNTDADEENYELRPLSLSQMGGISNLWLLKELRKSLFQQVKIAAGRISASG